MFVFPYIIKESIVYFSPLIASNFHISVENIVSMYPPLVSPEDISPDEQ